MITPTDHRSIIPARGRVARWVALLAILFYVIWPLSSGAHDDHAGKGGKGGACATGR